MASSIKYHIYPGKLQSSLDKAIEDISTSNVIDRLWKHDHTLWADTPEEITNRLDWLSLPESMPEAVKEITAYVDQAVAEGYQTALLLGMGGSSLAPDVFRRVFASSQGYLDLIVLDTTDASTIFKVAQDLDLSHTLFIVSTKSGGTVETLSLFKYFYNLTMQKLGKDEVGQHFTAITDPGSRLEKLATELDFRKIFLNTPNIGGRYSALSHFGMVPAALIGINITKFLAEAADMAIKTKTSPTGKNLGLDIGALMGAGSKENIDKITFISGQNIASLEDWVEQLIAESTGKSGKGILPIAGEALADDLTKYSFDRIFVITSIGTNSKLAHTADELTKHGHPVIQIELEDKYQLSSLMFAWEAATAIAGQIIGIHPFNQPNVEAAKKLATKSIETYKTTGTLPASETAPLSTALLEKFLSPVTPGDYIAIQAFVPALPEIEAVFRMLQSTLRDIYQVPVTFGFGPRYLHSTGQLHKGDKGKGHFIQFKAKGSKDISIPEMAGETTSFISFDILKYAQAIGDAQALTEENRPVLAIELDGHPVSQIKTLVEELTKNG